VRAFSLVFLSALLVWACSKAGSVKTNALDLSRQQQPLVELPNVEDRVCAECHASQVNKFKTHGMADALASLDPQRIPARLSNEFIENNYSGMRYNIGANNNWQLTAQHMASGSSLSVPINLRIGAGVAAMSFVINNNGRWFFSPLEYFTKQGWRPAPHEWHSSGGLDAVPITAQCLQCHTSSTLPDVHPLNNLQDFQPQPIGCVTCHGDGSKHVEIMRSDAFAADLAILNPIDFAVEQQLDLCARCHLEGDAHVNLSNGALQQVAPGVDLLKKHAVLVASESTDNSLRFVSQVQRLSASECFKQSPNMTCTSCHDPHQPARYQQRASFDNKCISCHDGLLDDHQAQAPEQSCVACHMPAVKPFDLQNVTIADHFIQARPIPQKEVAFKLAESPSGDWKTFSYRGENRYSDSLKRAMQAMALFEQGHLQRAAELFDSFSAPGRPQEITLSQFHFLRARSLFTRQQRAASELAYRDALLLDPLHTASMLNLATILAEDGKVDEASHLMTQLSQRYPDSEAPFNIAIIIANKNSDWSAMREAALNSLERNPQQQAIQRVLLQLNERNL
jgi:predicted CXXCH cytochrome family protein